MTAPSPHGLDNLVRAGHTADVWLDTVARWLGTKDRHYAYRVLRAWLHTVRDRVTVDAAAHFAAQLPTLLRGLFFDGWTPSQVPVKYDAEQFVRTVAQEANVSLVDARKAIPAVAAALTERCAPGQLEHLCAQLPAPIRALLRPSARTSTRLESVEHATQAALEALGTLVRGLEELPADEPRPERISTAARRAHAVLLEAAASDRAPANTS
ncbi:DUF2267 domain-containing protein [Pseudonocardia acaciae]|uniref:DUF2267 domain-containing protein n=1 Tax=Pseudonocardia acaciae TaxID=551276 RepID=UPI00056D2813|nr:DUF2267 domain-containing protein [Pseudonocardia acaciae]